LSSPRPQRADARRNREALLTAAREAFQGGELGIQVEEIARRAGVSVGTLYRHFDTREAVVEAVYRQEIDELCAAPAILLAEHSPDEALRRFLLLMIDHSSGGKGMTAVLKSIMATDLPVFDDARRCLSEALDTLLEAGITAGTIRPDADGQPVMRALGGVCGMSTLDHWAEDSLGIVSLLFDGLRYGAPTISATPGTTPRRSARRAAAVAAPRTDRTRTRRSPNA
jgi:AcrR family transcriptional regulator